MEEKLLNRITDLIREYAEKQQQPFKAADFFTFLEKNKIQYSSEEETDIIVEMLDNSPYLFYGFNDKYTPRHCYFRNAVFAVSLTSMEIDLGILIPGHRFVPFITPQIPAWEARITVEKDTAHGENTARDTAGSPVLKTKTVRLDIHDLQIFYTLYGIENMPAILIQNNAVNKTLFNPSGPDNTTVELTVFDIKQLVEDRELKPGALIKMNVLDWNEGLYSACFPAAGKMKTPRSGHSIWGEKLTAGFAVMFEELFPPQNLYIEEQIAYAYFFADTSVLNSAPFHLGQLVNHSPYINLVTLYGRTVLWREEEADPEYFSMSEGVFQPPQPTGKSGTIDEILDDLGISLSEPELESYIKDALYHGKKDHSSVIDRFLSGHAAGFFSEHQEKKFHLLFAALWDKISETYNRFKDERPGKIRKAVLEIYDIHLAWLRSLEQLNADPQSLPADIFYSMAQIIRLLMDFLLTIESREDFITDTELEESLTMVDDFRTTVITMIEDAEEQLSGFFPEEDS